MDAPPLAPSFADTLVDAAVKGCAAQHFSGDQNQVCAALRQGRCDVCGLFTNHLVNQIGIYLGQVDKNIKTVMRFEPEPTPLAAVAARDQGKNPQKGINLIAWVDRKSAALTSLGSSLESALAEARQKFGCPNVMPPCFSLDLQVVDDREVLESRSYGLAVNHGVLRSIRVWMRDDVVEDRARAYRSDPFLPLPSLDLELAPEQALFQQAAEIEKLPESERKSWMPRLEEIKVVLIRRLISDQLAYIQIAREWLTFEDLREIDRRRIGNGKIGGKAAGLVLAARILSEVNDPAITACVHYPPSYYIGSDLIYIFMAMNGLMHWNNQKYKPEEQIISEYPLICEQFAEGRFPPEVLSRLRDVLDELGSKPIIVRSSSQLEDNFGTSFAGKYQSTFCPNQGTPEENLNAFTQAISQTYASTLNPDALLYRRSKNLQDYDERMAVLIQVVQGQQFGDYYFPFAAGVAFSRNLYRWAPQIRREEGFARMVWGLGTHAVERGGNDYPRLVALSHPTLQPDDDPRAIRYYSQRSLDVIDLKNNEFKTLRVKNLMNSGYPPLRFLTQIEEDGYLSNPRTRMMEEDIPRVVITYDELLRRTSFAADLSRILKNLEKHYRFPIDIEFTVSLEELEKGRPAVHITLLQCRPQSHLQTVKSKSIPDNLAKEDIVFSSSFMVPQGYLERVRYVIYIDPDQYFALPTQAERNEVSRIVSTLNVKLPVKAFICVGPGRWGSTNPDLGVFVNYADVFNAGALVELCGASIGLEPEPSFGTHFFQDLMEAQIYPIAVHLDDPQSTFNHAFFTESLNMLMNVIPVSESYMPVVRLIDVAACRSGCHLEIYLDGDQNHTVAYFAPDAAAGS